MGTKPQLGRMLLVTAAEPICAPVIADRRSPSAGTRVEGPVDVRAMPDVSDHEFLKDFDAKLWAAAVPATFGQFARRSV